MEDPNRNTGIMHVAQDSSEPVLPLLSQPIELAGKQLRNRVVHLAMATNMAAEMRATPQLIQYSVNRALGGAAMVVTEPLGTARHQNVPTRVRAWNDDAIETLKRWADAVESQDCRLVAQIQDSGRGRHNGMRAYNALGPSALPDDLSWTVPHALTSDEIRRLIDDFSQSAARLKRCGFSGVELSSGHGHLFSQFLSPWSNRRTDEYGGDWTGRARFMTQLITAIRGTCGRDFILGLKIPGDDGVPGGIGPAEAALIANILTASREVDYVCFAQGAHARSLEMLAPDSHWPRLPWLHLMRKLKSAVNGVPIMALGRISDPSEAEALLAHGDAELIGMGRALLADPAWYLKAMRGRSNEIRRCIACNSCWDTIVTLNAPVTCVNNPRVAMDSEVDWWPKRTPIPRRVVVVGSGIAGMEAAWVAAARGHDVTVFGRSDEIGGKAKLRSLLPGGETIANVYNYQFLAAQRAGVSLQLGREVNDADILASKPDAVILATGSSMLRPEWFPADKDVPVLDLQSGIQAVIKSTLRNRGTAIVYDMDHTEGTYAAVELLAKRYERVVLLTPRASIAQDVSLVTRQGILRRLSLLRVEIIGLVEPIWNECLFEGCLAYENVYSKERGLIKDVSFLSYATPSVPNAELAKPLRAAGVEIHFVGDCRVPRGLIGATADGHAVGNAV